MHHDVGDGVKTARAQVFGTRNEIAGRIVDEIGQRTLSENRLDHFVHGERIADIDAVAGDAAAIQVHQFGGGFVANRFAPTADMHLGPELEKACGHRFAKSGAATGNENAPPGEKLIVEHRFHPNTIVY